MARVTIPRKLIIKLISSYCFITILGAVLAFWFHSEQATLLAAQEEQSLQNEGDSVVVASPAYELITSTDNEISEGSHLKDVIMQIIGRKALTIIAIEEQETKRGNQLNIEVNGALQDYFTFATELTEAHPTLEIKPQELKKENGQLHILFTVSSRML